MTNPQKENGYTAIANEIMDALIKIRISGESRQVLDCILRKTYGWNKKEDWISLSQFTEATGLKKPTVCKALNKLLSMNIITKKGNAITQKDNGYCIKYGFQKDYKKWIPLPKKVTLPKKVITVTKKGNLPLPKKIPTKDTITKDTITKDKEQFILPDWIPLDTWNAYLEVRNKKKAAKTQYALNLIIKKLEGIKSQHSHDPTDVLNQSITGGWSDVYPLKNPQNRKELQNERFNPDQQESERILAEANRRFREEIKKRSAADKDIPDP